MKLLLSIIFIIFTQCFADTRSFVWTYESSTMPAGSAEFEHYLTLTSPNLDSLNGNVTSQHDMEIEVGMNDRFDIGIYQSFEQEPGKGLAYKGFKIRGRYRLMAPGALPFNPVIYLEYKGEPDFQRHTAEWKLILTKKFPNGVIAVNPIVELEKGDDNSEISFQYSTGIGYRFSSLVGFGLEFKGGPNGHYWGPVLSHGHGGLYMALGSAISATPIKNNKPDFMVRFLMGIELH